MKTCFSKFWCGKTECGTCNEQENCITSTAEEYEAFEKAEAKINEMEEFQNH